jgi:hypothetical protein
MQKPSKMVLYAFRGVSGLSLLLGLFLFTGMVYAIVMVILNGPLNEDRPNPWLGVLAFLIAIVPMFGIVGYLLSRYGLKGTIRKPSPDAVKGLCGIWAFVFLIWLEGMIGYDYGTRVTTGDGPSDPAFFINSVGSFATLLLAIVLYGVSYRFILKSLALPCPPMQQTLPRWPLTILGFYLFCVLTAGLSWINPPGRMQIDDSIVPILLSTFVGWPLTFVIPIICYKKAVRTFATPPSPDQPSTPAEPTGPPPSMNMGTEP